MPQSDWLGVETTTVPSPAAPPETARVWAMVAPTAPAEVVNRVTIYSTLSAMEGDGWGPSFAAYNAMAKLLEQTPTATQLAAIRVIRRDPAVAEIWPFDIVDTTDATIELFINGVLAATFTASTSTAEQIKDGLLASLIGLAPTYTGATVDTDTGSIENNSPGVPFVLTSAASAGTAPDVSAGPSVAAVGIYDDLQDAFPISNFRNVLAPGASDADLDEARRWVGADRTTRRTFLWAENADAGVFDPGDTDNLAVQWQTGKYPRVNLLSHPNATEYMASGAAGRLGGMFPGSRAWHYVDLSGSLEIAITSLRSETDTATMLGRSISYTERLAGPTSALKLLGGSTSAGTPSSPKWVFQIWAEDWIWYAGMATLDSALKSAAGINIDEPGLQAVSDQLEAMLGPMLINGVIDDDYSVSFIPIDQIPPGEISQGNLATSGGWVINVTILAKARKLKAQVFLSI